MDNECTNFRHIMGRPNLYSDIGLCRCGKVSRNRITGDIIIEPGPPKSEDGAAQKRAGKALRGIVFAHNRLKKWLVDFSYATMPTLPLRTTLRTILETLNAITTYIINTSEETPPSQEKEQDEGQEMVKIYCPSCSRIYYTSVHGSPSNYCCGRCANISAKTSFLKRVKIVEKSL